MNVIFLDVDGVLNCLSRWKELPNVSREGTKLCPELTARLKRLVDATDARIVVSSTWRIAFMAELAGWLHRHGIRDRVIGRTPSGGSGSTPGGILVSAPERGHEIQMWLDDHPEVQRFVILDDSTDMAHLSDRLVRTTWQDGLQDEHVEQAIEMLTA